MKTRSTTLLAAVGASALLALGAILAAAASLGLGGGWAAPAFADAGGGGRGLVVYGDTVRGPAGLPPEEIPILSCVQANRFPQGSTMVWRVRVVDPVTLQPMDDAALAHVTLTLPDGSTKGLTYGPHPRGRTDDYFWTTAFAVPDDYPTGAFEFQIVATATDGRVGVLVPFNVQSSMLQIVAKGAR